MTTSAVTRQYWGWTIESHSGQNPDGTWTAFAQLKPGAAQAHASAVQQFQATAPTQAGASSAALAKASAAVDQQRISSGKP